MSDSLTLVGAMSIAIAALAAAVGVLYRTSVKREEDGHKVSLSMLEVLTLLKVGVADLRGDVDKLVMTRTEQLDRIESDARVHNERMLMLHDASLKHQESIGKKLDEIRRQVYGADGRRHAPAVQEARAIS